MCHPLLENHLAYCKVVTMVEIFSKQYTYSIVRVHLFGKLKIKLLYETARNRKLRNNLNNLFEIPTIRVETN
jgi:hypothetical protein